MSDACASLTQGILAYSNTDLVANGFIKQTDVDRRHNSILMLPSSRITVELQYSVRSDISGTNLNSLSPGGNTGFVFGSLGGGAGFGIGQALGCDLQGDIEPTRSRFVFHVCESATHINRAIPVTASMLAEAAANNGVTTYDFLNEYPIGVLGVTKKPIELTDDEQTNIGSDGGPQRGHNITNDGLVEATFSKYSSTGEQNLFLSIVRDDRKFKYRADNNIPGDPLAGANCFPSASPDDLVDTKIQFQLIPPQGQPNTTPPKVGDTIYLSFVAAKKRIVRHAIFASSFFFLFPFFKVERIGIDQVHAWNFHPFKFKAHKNHDSKATINDIINDDKVNANSELSAVEKIRRIRLEIIEGMRVCECINDTKDQRAYIRGFYFADSRGILSFDVSRNETTLLVPAARIRDQEWWNGFIASYMDGGPGFDANGQLNLEAAGANRLLRGFVFDVSDHVNCVCYDNDKFGYQRELANALATVSAFDSLDDASGVGFSNLDLERLNMSHKGNYDLSSAKFQTTKMSSIEGGAYFIRDCNTLFTYDQQFCASGTVQSDMFIRTPIFFDDLPAKTRIYVERFTPQFPLNRDGGIWVTTKPTFSGGISVDAHPYNDDAFLVFEKDSVLNYHRFRDASARIHTTNSETDYTNPALSHNDIELASLTQESISVVGFDKIIGNQPGYSRGLEITREGGKIALGLESSSIFQTAPTTFAQTGETEYSVADLGGKRIRSLIVTYTPLDGFLSQPARYLTFVFPNTKLVIDNVALTYEGNTLKTRRFIMDTRYYNGDAMRITGDILRFMQINKIEVVYLEEDKYLENAIEAADSSVVLDSQGKIYIFYEDTKGAVGSYGDQGDGGDVAAGQIEISCLVSNDMGHTWYDHKGVVYTTGTEIVRKPYAVHDTKSNQIHLFYIINDTLLHKAIPASMFVPEDAYKAWKRPVFYNEDTPDDFGLMHFSTRGRQIRKKESNVVVGNNQQEGFLQTQLNISSLRKDKKLSQRIVMGGDFKSFESGFPGTDFIAYFDRKRSLKLMYVEDGKLFVRTSGSNGAQWNDVLPNGVLFHKNSSVQEPQFVSSLGFTFHEKSNILNLSYIADEMLFMRSFDGSIFEQSRPEAVNQTNPTDIGSRPLFIVGTIQSEIAQEIEANNSNILFRYPIDSVPFFDQSMAVSEVGARGFVGASGLTRFYYQDSNGEMRGFSMLEDLSPVLDAKSKARSK